MTQTVVLHGKKSGYIRFEQSSSVLNIKAKSIPDNGIIYLVNERNVPVPFDRHYTGRISGVIITDAEGKILAEGRSAHAVGTNAQAKMRLPHPKSAQKAEQREHSAILDEILHRADIVFSPIDTQSDSKKDTTACSGHKKGNPFSALYPDSKWRMQPHGRTYMLTGTAYVAGEQLEIRALPADAFTEAEFSHSGFYRVATSDDGRVFRMKVIRKKSRQ